MSFPHVVVPTAADRLADQKAQQERELKDQERSRETCEAHFRPCVLRFQASLKEAVNDLRAVLQNPRADTNTDEHFGMLATRHPYPYMRLLGFRPASKADQASVPVRDMNMTYQQALDHFLDYPTVARAMLAQGFFLLRSQVGDWAIAYGSLYFVCRSWRDHDKDEAALPHPVILDRYMDEQTLAADLKAHGFSDQECKTCIFGSGHDQREQEHEQAAAEAKAAEAARRASSCHCTIL